MSTVPSNLVRTRITQLPEYAGTDTLGYIPYVLDGVTYKVQYSQLPAAGNVNLSNPANVGVLPLVRGGTGSGNVVDAGAIIYSTGTAFVGSPIGVAGQVLTSNGSGAPYWSSGGGGSGTVTSINVSGASTGLTFTGGPITTAGTITLGGTLGIGYGGTGATTANGALNAFLPTQTGNNGKFLSTDGSNTSWAAVSGSGTVTSVNVSGSTTGLTFTGGPITTSGTITLGGTLAIANGGSGQTTANGALNAFLPTQTGNNGKVLSTDGTNTSWLSVGGSGTVTSVDGSGGTTGLTLTGGPITASGTLTLGGTLAITNGGTGATTAATARANLSAAVLGANGDITSLTGLTGGISTPTFLQFSTATTPTTAVGRLSWNQSDGTLNLGMLGGNVTLQVGEEMLVRVVNKSGVALTDGQVVYLSGAQGNRVKVDLAIANGSTSIARTVLGIVTEAIPNNGEGFVTLGGLVRDLNTSAYADGDILYLSSTVAGGITNVRPTAPIHVVIVGYCVNANPSVGSIFVSVQPGYDLEDLSDVAITTPTIGQTLIYNSASQIWVNNTLTPGSGISITNGNGAITIATSGFGTMSTQNANAVAITGGSVNGTTVGASTASTGSFTSLAYSTTFTGGTGIVALGTSQFYKDASGNIGIGIASPIAKLHILDETSSAFFIDGYSNSSGPIIRTRAARGTLAAPTAVTSGTLLGGMRGFGYNGTAFSTTYTGGVNIIAAETFTTIAQGTYVTINTTALGAVATTERMRIDAAGNVGIGNTPSGTYTLEVTGNISASTGFVGAHNGTVGATTPSTGAFTTISATGAITSTLATGTAPFTVASTTNVVNLNASSLSGATFAAPGAIGGTTPAAITGTTITANTAFAGPHNGTVGATTPSTGAFTTISATGVITSTQATGTAPFTVASQTNVANLNASFLNGSTFAAPNAIGGTTPAAITGTTITANTAFAGPHNGTVGATTPNTGAFTTLTASTNINSTRINPRIGTVASSATVTPTGDASDQYNVTALAVAATIAVPSGTPVDGQKLTLRIKDNGTARALTWTTSAGGYRIVGTTLPTTTVLSKTAYIGCVYNAADSFWDVIAVAQQA